VKNEIQILSKYWSFHGNSVDEACCLLEWIAWNSFEVQQQQLPV